MMKKTLIATAVASAFSLNAIAADVNINGYLGAGFEFGDSEANIDGKTMAGPANSSLMLIINIELAGPAIVLPSVSTPLASESPNSKPAPR